MYCQMMRGVYIRCNGEMACYCGPGETITLAQLPLEEQNFCFIKDYYFNTKHQYIRNSMVNNILPFPSVCLKCVYLKLNKSEIEKLNHEIEWMHIESTSQCNLGCKFCIPQKERRSFRKPPYYLPIHLFKKIINDTNSNGYKVDKMYFSGRGEPCLHQHIWDMVEYAKKVLKTNFLVNTNGNIKYSNHIVESGLDKIKIAIDGNRQEIYEKYRVHGKLYKIFELTNNISEYKNKLGKKTPKIIWQYILFSYNDSIEDLVDLQKKAIELGVDEVLFKTTFTMDNYSKLDIKSIPIIHPNVKFLDIREMFTSKLDEINQMHEKLFFLKKNNQNKDAIIKAIEISSNIIKGFMIGLNSKTTYNLLANDDLTLLKFIKQYKISEDNDLKSKVEILLSCFDILSKSYKKDFQSKASEYFDNILSKC